MTVTYKKGPYKGASEPSWIDTWVLAKPELIPAHLAWIFTLVLAVFAIFAWRDAKETTANLTSQLEILQSEQRPWAFPTAAPTEEIKLIVEKKVTAFDRARILVTLQLPIDNAGKLPARLVHLEGNLLYRVSHVVQESERQHGLDIESKACKAVRTSADWKGRSIYVFPGQHARLNGDFDMYPDEENSWRENAGKPYMDLVVTGCIDYVIGNKNAEHHQTGFAFRLLRKDGIPPPDIIRSDKIEFTDLKLEPVEDARLDAD